MNADIKVQWEEQVVCGEKLLKCTASAEVTEIMHYSEMRVTEMSLHQYYHPPKVMRAKIAAQVILSLLEHIIEWERKQTK